MLEIPLAVLDARPAPTSSGQLARTPLPHLLVYTYDRQLTGTFEFRAPDGTTASALLVEGRPAKARLSSAPIYLGQVLLEIGAVDAMSLDESLRELAAMPPGRLHGMLLLEHGKITADQLVHGLEVQLLQKLAAIAQMPAATVFEFYADWDGLSTFGADPTPIDAMAAVWAAIREQPPFEHMKTALERMTRGRLRLSKSAQLDRFGFTLEEKRWIELLHIRPMRLDHFFAAADVNERITRLIVYCLAITKQIDLIGEETDSPDPSSSSKLPAAPSSSPAPLQRPLTPIQPINAVARVALRRERVTTQNAIVEEKSSPRIPMPDRRASPPPDAPGAVSEVPPPLDVRRKEITERAQLIDKQNYFDMLGVKIDAPADDVKSAYLALAKTWHPDRLPTALADVKDACGRVFARMSEAHQTLIDEEKRKRYLRLMKEGGETPEQQQEIANVVTATVEFQKAEICLRKNDLAQAEVLARHAAKLDPEQADYIALIAWLDALKPSAQSPEATQTYIAELDRALKLNERCERAYFYRAMLHKRLRRDALAFKDFKKVAELNPKNIDAQRELRLYEMRGGSQRPTTAVPSQPPASNKPGLFQKFFKK
ncbi:MAG TPA: DnaJ domain-containing protein [Polyangiaceae bacterium]|jgi:curved DNA-binding protein CbpA